MTRPTGMHPILSRDSIIGIEFLARLHSCCEHGPEYVGKPHLFLLRNVDADVAESAKAQVKVLYSPCGLFNPGRHLPNASGGALHRPYAIGFKRLEYGDRIGPVSLPDAIFVRTIL